MIVKNIMEDIVINAVIEMLKDYDEKLLKCSACVEDIVCYVLNRIDPKYITSGRGVLFIEKDFKHDLQKTADIYSHISEAIKLITEKGWDEEHLAENDFFYNNTVVYNDSFYLNYPYFTGRVVMSDGSPLKEEVTITLFRKEDNKFVKAQMANPNWKNPFVTSVSTYGYYTFWVKPNVSKNQDKENIEEVTFRVSVKSKSYQPQEKFLNIKIKTEKARYLSVRTEHAVRIEDTMIDLYP